MGSHFEAEVTVMPKPEVADPQGQAIEQALARLALSGTEGVRASHVRVGKVVHLELEAADRASAERALEALADRVLANPNIESFSCSIRDPK
ncbi:phosphoribosylformylglycinamidine synthase subunit PurS [Candidatus Sumerlaeota bacterium]|nr:phosphoribosylformylglycinamidine synthase subunit PurS [Candidatus Sumerlaeota bacterium]